MFLLFFNLFFCFFCFFVNSKKRINFKKSKLGSPISSIIWKRRKEKKKKRTLFFMLQNRKFYLQNKNESSRNFRRPSLQDFGIVSLGSYSILCLEARRSLKSYGVPNAAV